MKRLLATMMMLGMAVPMAFGQTADRPSDTEVRNRMADMLRDIQPDQQFTPSTHSDVRPPVLRWLEFVPPEPIDWQDKPFNEIVEWLGNQESTGAPVNMNIIMKTLVMEEAGVDTEYEVNLQVRNLSLGKILNLVLGEVGGSDPATQLGYVAQDNLLTLSTQDDLNSKLYLKAYDVTDIILNVPDFINAPTLDVTSLQERQGQQSRGGGGGGGSGQLFQGGSGDESGEESKRTAKMEQLVELIQETIARDSWQANGGEGTISFNGSSLIVYNTLEVHQKIESAQFGGVLLSGR